MSLAHYVPPAASEWQTLVAQAEVLARTNIVPRQYRGKPDDIVAVFLMARELDLQPIAALSLIDVIEGTPTLNAEGKVAVVRGHGHSIQQVGEVTAAEATVHGKRWDTGDEATVTWTIQMARDAGLAGKGTWKQYAPDMLWSRAVSTLCRRLFPDVVAGLSYTAEEAQSFKRSSVVVETAPAAELPAAAPIPLASEEQRKALTARLNALPGGARSAFKQAFGVPADLTADRVADAARYVSELEQAVARDTSVTVEASPVVAPGEGADDSVTSVEQSSGNGAVFVSPQGTAPDPSPKKVTLKQAQRLHIMANDAAMSDYTLKILIFGETGGRSDSAKELTVSEYGTLESRLTWFKDHDGRDDQLPPEFDDVAERYAVWLDAKAAAGMRTGSGRSDGR